MSPSRVLAFIVGEFKEMIPPTLFFAVGFNLIVLTTNLILQDYSRAHFSSFVLATTGALIVGKSVLIANALPFFRRFDNAPMIRPVLFKSAIYFLAVGIVRLAEKGIEYLRHGGGQDLPTYMATHFTWDRFIAIQLWVLVLFLVYTFISELNALFGDGELRRILFSWRPTALKQSRRQRMRALATLSRLTDEHGLEELADPKTPAHGRMIAVLRSLATKRT